MRWFGGDARWSLAHLGVGGRDAGPADVREGTEPVGPICGDGLAALWGLDGGTVGSFESRANQRQSPIRMGLQVLGQ